MELINEIISYYKNLKTSYKQEELAQLLKEIQDVYGCVSLEIQSKISKELNIGLPIIQTLVKKYPSLREQPAKHRITVCTGRNCHNKGCGKLLEKIEKETRAGIGEASPDGRFHINTQCCLKHCSTAPNLKIDNEFYTNVSEKDISNILEKYQ